MGSIREERACVLGPAMRSVKAKEAAVRQQKSAMAYGKAESFCGPRSQEGPDHSSGARSRSLEAEGARTGGKEISRGEAQVHTQGTVGRAGAVLGQLLQ